MCGIFFSTKNYSKNQVEKKLDTIKFRGPDNFGYYNDNFVTLGHLRLSILDLSNAGNQPMISQSGRFVITYNGEIYNHKDIRKEISTDWKFKKDKIINKLELVSREEFEVLKKIVQKQDAVIKKLAKNKKTKRVKRS